MMKRVEGRVKSGIDGKGSKRGGKRKRDRGGKRG